MPKLILLAILQAMILTCGQVLLKLGLDRMPPFSWTVAFWQSFLANWQFALSGLSFAAASLLWMYIIRNFPFSSSFPMLSLFYVLCAIASQVVFHEVITPMKWVGLLLIIVGCVLIGK